MTAPREWNAEAYQRLSEPQFNWGLRVLERLPLEGHETVIDAGCGTGRLTSVLLDRLPRGRVIGVDQSSNMIEEASRRLAGRSVSFVCADLTRFVASEPVDAIFSTATFHWLRDHDALFASLYGSLRPGGRLVAQCGGAGNLEKFHACAEEVAAQPEYREWFVGFEAAWNFQGAEATAERLRRAGFGEVKCWLEEAPTTFADRETFREFAGTVVLRQHLGVLPEGERAGFLAGVVEKAGAVGLDYVRLNIEGRRGGLRCRGR